MAKNCELFVTRSATDANAPQSSGVAVSSTNTYYSVKLDGSLYLSFSLIWTGTPTGTFTLWGSNKSEPNEASDADWFAITPTPAFTNPAGSASRYDGAVNATQNSRWKRVKYVNATGSGTLTGYAAVGDQF
jgi:hypothetical protein